MVAFEAAYLELWRSGALAQRAQAARAALSACALCGHACGVNRLRGEQGRCRTGAVARVHGAAPHFGEERPLVGTGGSGTIFFSRCNLACQFCQNYELSHLDAGEDCHPSRLARLMLGLQAAGCHNLNLVSPTHVLPMILDALVLAAGAGLRLPIVYNTGGYDSQEALRLLAGVVDIYLPDMKFADAEVAHRLCGARHYPQTNQAAVRLMHQQVGDLAVDADGLARRGLLVRHLILPAGLGGTAAVAQFLADEVSAETWINVMDQYRPPLGVHLEGPLRRRVLPEEAAAAVAAVRAAGLRHVLGA